MNDQGRRTLRRWEALLFNVKERNMFKGRKQAIEEARRLTKLGEEIADHLERQQREDVSRYYANGFKDGVRVSLKLLLGEESEGGVAYKG